MVVETTKKLIRAKKVPKSGRLYLKRGKLSVLTVPLKGYRLGLHVTLSTTGWADKWKDGDKDKRTSSTKRSKNAYPLNIPVWLQITICLVIRRIVCIY